MGYTVVQISQNLPPVIGGGETYANRLVAALKRRGITLIRIGEYRNTLDLPDNPHDKTISIPGFNETVFSFQNLLSTSQVLSELLLDIKPDVIHTHNFFSGVLGLLSAPSNVPLIHTEHHTPYWSTLHERHTLADLHTKLFPFFFSAPRLSAIMASSKYFLEYLKPFLHKSCLQEVVYPIIPHAFADAVTKKEAADRLGLNASEYLRPAIILCPSRLTPRKRIESLFYALSQIHSINWICIISAGEEAPSISYRTFLEELAHRLNICNKIVYDLRISDERMPYLYQLADVVTLPSAEEGLGIAALESMYSGTPFIGNVNRGFQEVLEVSCSDDFLIDCENTSLYAQTILSCLTRKRSLERISQVQAHIKHYCSEQVVVEQVIGLYHKLLDSHFGPCESEDITSKVISFSGSSFFLERADDKLVIRKDNVSENEISWSTSLYNAYTKYAGKTYSLKIARTCNLTSNELFLEYAKGLTLRHIRNINCLPILENECFTLILKSVYELYQIIGYSIRDLQASEGNLLFEESANLRTLGDWIDYHGLQDPLVDLCPVTSIQHPNSLLFPLFVTHGTINLDHLIIDRLSYVTIVDYGNHIGMRPCTFDLMNLVREELRFPVGKQNSWNADDWLNYINQFIECANSLSFFEQAYHVEHLLLEGYICMAFLIRRSLLRMGIDSRLRQSAEPNRIANIHRLLYDKIIRQISEKIACLGN